MSLDDETSALPAAPPVPPPPTPWALPDGLPDDEEHLEKRQQKELQFHMVGAIESGDTKLLETLIESGVDTNAVILLVKTPLTHAVEQENVNNNIVKLLLNGKADPNSGDHDEWSKKPLHTIAAKNLVETAKLFFEYPKDGENATNVDVRDNGRMSPLHFGARYGSTEMVSYLISQSADVHAKDDCWKTPLHRAIEELHFDAMAILLENGASVNCADIDGWTPLFHSVFFGHMEMVQLLILTGADVNHVSLDSHTPLHIACSVQRPSRWILKKELSSSFDYYYRTRNMSTDEFKRFFQTNKMTNIEMVQILVNAGADVNAISDIGESPVILTEDFLVQKYLILAGGRVDEDDMICPGGYGNGNRQAQACDETTAYQPFSSASEYQNWVITQCSLQHTLLRLCRTTIRKYLASTSNIRESVKTLPIPVPLKSCLNLDDFKTDFVER